MSKNEIIFKKSMDEKDELFGLIKSLSKSEKRYFRIYSARHIIRGQNNYIRLFDFLDKQKLYDKEKVLTQFAGQKFIHHLDVTKNYLVKIILQSLRAFNNYASPEHIVAAYTMDIEILLEKGLVERANKVLIKAKKIAEIHFLYLKLLELLQLGIHIGARQDSITNVNSIYKKNFDEKEGIIRLLNNINEYDKLIVKIFNVIRRTNVIREKRELKLLNKIMSNPLLKNEKNAISFYSRLKFYEAWTNYCRVIDDPFKLVHYEEKYIALMESSYYFMSTQHKFYLVAFNNYISSCIQLKRYEDAERAIEKFRKFQSPSKIINAEGFQRLCDLELNYLKATGQFEKGMNLMPTIEKGNEKHKSWLQKSLEIELNMQCCCIFIGAGKYKKALSLINILLNEPQTNLRDDLYCSLRILNLIVHFEIGNQLMLPYLLKSTYRFFYKRNMKNGVEKIILKNFRKLANSNSAKELKLAYKGILNQLIKLSNERFEKGAFEFFDFISWLESKIENRPFSEVVKEKAKIRVQLN